VKARIRRAGVTAVLCALVISCAQNNNSREPLAVVDGQPIYEEELLPAIRPQLQQLARQEYQVKGKALESAIEKRILAAEAKRRSLSVEQLLDKEVRSKVTEPTDDDVLAFYNEKEDSLKRPFDSELQTQIRDALRLSAMESALSFYVDKVRDKTRVAVLLRPPFVDVEHDPERMRGNPDAPVTIVEFSDFQCPFCGAVQPTLKQLMTKYEGKVRLSYRDFPLGQIHSNAERAAQAARCAGEQNKFWEYHDLLFADQRKLDIPSLKEHSRNLKLNEIQFDTCIASNKFQKAVRVDAEDGSKAGVNGTPGFFINGIAISGAQPIAVFEQLIDSELRKQK